VQVDLGVPQRFEALLRHFFRKEDSGWRILPTSDTVALDVLKVFGRSAGEVLTANSGLNELASALVASKDLEPVLRPLHRIAIAACIEATIPFREKVGERLSQRLTAVPLNEEETSTVVERAIRLANRDVSNFAEDDPARFLDNTWKLLPETNPSLHTPEAYSVTEYRVALQKMERFLSSLRPERVFQKWGGVPTAERYAQLLATTTRNIALAVRYLRARLYSTAVLEAIAELTGGDAPIEYFLGGLTEENGRPPRRLEHLLMHLTASTTPLDPLLRRLLIGGRSTNSSFDLSPSPLAAVLTENLGEQVVMTGFDLASRMWAGSVSATDFLREQPRPTIQAVIDAVAQIAETRREALSHVLEL
jgi:hypothetical protein